MRPDSPPPFVHPGRLHDQHEESSKQAQDTALVVTKCGAKPEPNPMYPDDPLPGAITEQPIWHTDVGSPPPIEVQPAFYAAPVVIQAHPPRNPNWNHGLFDCLHDIGNCLCGTCLPCCLIYETAQTLDSTGCLYGCCIWCCTLSCGLSCLATCMLRKKVRHRYGIYGLSICDCLASCLCTCCANIQLANEVNTRKSQES